MTPYNWIMIKIRAGDWCGFFLVLGGAPRFHSNFTDKAPFLADLSVSKTHFTDKPSFSGDLSVNFWPLWWGFTDKQGFLEHLSVKPGPNRLNFYGQTAVFDHFVRNRHFSSRPFTDKRPIFIDVSVNGKGNWVEHFSKFLRFCSTFGTARAEFGVSGRTFFQFFEILFYFQSRAPWIWTSR